MRIIAGRFGGRRLAVPDGVTRPTTDRVREALFSSLQNYFELSGCRVLDVFAGSGALGLEALSRGAANATFVDASRRAVEVIRKNVQALSAEDSCHVFREDAVRFVKGCPGGVFDLVFADPPYRSRHTDELPGLILRVLRKGGLLILEHDHRRDFSAHPGLVRSRAYGDTVLSQFAAPVT